MGEYVYRKIVAPSRNVCTSSAEYHFTQRERFCGGLMSPAAVKPTWVFIYAVYYLCLILTKFGINQQIVT